MKLDKIRFARLIAYIQDLKQVSNKVLEDYQIEHIDNLTDVEVPVVENVHESATNINDMLKSIADNRKIDAIRAYRNLTGLGLKEAKDAIEAYWLRQPAPVKPGINTMLDCIDTHIESVGTASSNPYFLLNSFSKSDIGLVRNFIESFAN